MSNLRTDLQIAAAFIPPHAKVLDLGCGTGELLEFLVRQKQAHGRGIELSEAGVLACVARGLSVRQGHLGEGLADYPDHSFDYVILSQTLPFLDNPEQILKEMLRVGQRAVVSFPNWGYWRCRLSFLLSGRVPPAPSFDQTWHGRQRWQLFTIADFQILCRWAGIAVQDMVCLTGQRRVVGPWPNLRARTAVFLLRQIAAR